MQSIFVKLFLAFWATTLAGILAVIVGGHYIDGDLQDPENRPAWMWQHDARHLMSFIETRLEYAKPEDLGQWFGQYEGVPDMQFYVLSLDNQLLQDIEPATNLSHIAAQLSTEEREVRHREGDFLYMGRLLVVNGQPYAKMLVGLDDPEESILLLLQSHIWLRVLIAFVVSGLGCYLTARQATKSILRIQKVARQLADGQLDARIDVPASGGDESDQLSRDFNFMAGRLQETIEDHKQLVRDISHELRSPLSRIQTALALAQRKGAGPSAELDRVARECDRLNDLIGQLLVMPDHQVQLEDTADLVHLLKDVVDDNSVLAQEAHKRLELSALPPQLLVKTKGDLLYRAIDNLIRNALRHTPSATAVSVVFQHRNNELIIAVRDQGPGVKSEELEKIFLPFYRVQTARDRATGGYGLGLSIAQRAIEQHGGYIQARNTSEGFEVAVHLPQALQLDDENNTD